MPIVKAISGHTNCQKAKSYLEKNGRALARDFFNLSWDEREMAGYDESLKESVQWADEMDLTRIINGNDKAYEGRRARTYKHFIISPDPEDSIDLESLRELASSWAMRFFPDYQVAIVYHDDNENNIPHAHLIVNCTNLVTGNRLHTDDPLALNRALQDMAIERGLRGLSNEARRKEAKALLDAPGIETPRTIQGIHMSRPEAELVSSGRYSWVADIRNRVAIAKELARNEGEFRQVLKAMDVEIRDSSGRSNRADWVFSLADDPKCKVTGGRLGFAYSKDALRNRFENKATYHVNTDSSREALIAAKNAVVLNDLGELGRLAAALETCSRYGIKSESELLTYIASMEGRLENGHISASTKKALVAMRDAYEFVADKGILPKTAVHQHPASKAGGKSSGEGAGRKRGQQPKRHEKSHEDGKRKEGR